MLAAETSSIVFITRSWHGTGGMQRLSKDLARELAKVYGSRLMVIHPVRPGIVSLIGFAFRAIRAGMALRSTKPHIHLGDASVLPIGVLLKKMTDGRLSLTACGLDVIWPPRWYQQIIRMCLKHVDCIVCISEATRVEVLKRGVSEDKTMVIPCGVNVPASSDTHRDPYLIVTVGRLVKRKGAAWFLEHALPLILEKNAQARYVIAGSGPDEQKIREIIDLKKLADFVELRTNCSDAERNELLSAAAVFAMPVIPVAGDIEGFGIVCIEASVRGTPVAAARIGGVQDAVIEHVTGGFFSAGNAEACAERVLSLLKNPLKDDDVSRATVETYGWPTVISSYKNVFDA